MISITKAKIVKGDGLEIHFIETEADNMKVPKWEKCPAIPHPDLNAAWEALAIHLAIMTGYVKPGDIKDLKKIKPEMVEGFKVTSFSLGGDEEKEGIVLSGHKILYNKKAVILNTPFTRFEEQDATRYQFMDELDEAIGDLRDEITKFMAGTKRGSAKPGELPFGGDVVVTKAVVLGPEEKPLFNQTGNGTSEVWVDAPVMDENKPVKIGDADPDAMKRVAAMGTEDEGKVAKETNENPTPKGKGKPKGGARKVKVAQTADAPGGEMEVLEPEN